MVIVVSSCWICCTIGFKAAYLEGNFIESDIILSTTGILKWQDFEGMESILWSL